MTTPPGLFPMRDLVQKTGVNASTLRAWENRHGLLHPARAASGHRLYSMKDVDRIQRLQGMLGLGMSLDEIGTLLDAPDASEDMACTAPTAWQAHIGETLSALEDFCIERLERLYNEACALYPIGVVTERLLIPVMKRLGERWDRRPAGVAEEHFFSAWLRNKLGARLHHAVVPDRARSLIVACLPGEIHEVGLLIFALEAVQINLGVIYLGANMPIRQILPVCRCTHPAGIVLAGRDVENRESVLEDIAWLADASKVPLFVGSHFSVTAQDELSLAGAVPLGIDPTLALRKIDDHLHALRSMK